MCISGSNISEPPLASAEAAHASFVQFCAVIIAYPDLSNGGGTIV